MHRSSIGFIARSLSLAAAAVATAAIASASQQAADLSPRITSRPMTDAVGRFNVAIDRGSSSHADALVARSQDPSPVIRVDPKEPRGRLLAVSDMPGSDLLASVPTDSRPAAPETARVETKHPLRFTSILATLALIAFFFLRRLI